MSEDSDGRLGTGRSSSPESIAEDDNVPAYVRALMRAISSTCATTVMAAPAAAMTRKSTSPARSSCCTQWQPKYCAR